MSSETQDAYVFVPSGSDETMTKLKDLWSQGYVRYATRVLSGGFGAVAFLEAEAGAEALETLRSKLTAVRNKVNPGTSVGVAFAVGPRAPTRWSDKKAVGAYVRIRAERGMARAVFDQLNDRFGDSDQYGSALVVGDWDVLLEVDADTFDDLGPMIEAINGVDGIVSTDSALVLNDATEPTGPGSQ